MKFELEGVVSRTMEDPSAVAVFTRQSTKKKSQEKSIPRQRMGLREWAKTIGWAFPKDKDCFYEKKISGTRLNPEFDRLMADIASGRRKAILIDDLSRATRLALKTFQLWDLIKKTGTLLAIRSRYLVINPRYDQQDILIFFEGMLSEAHWETLGRMSADGSRFRASKGLWCGGPVPSGFVRKSKGVLAPDRAHLRDIEMQLLATESLSLRQASRFLKEQVGLDVAPSTLHHRAHNPIYESALVYGRTKRGFFRNPEARLGDAVLRKSQKAGPEDAIILPGAIQSPVAAAVAVASRKRLESSKNNSDGMGIRRSSVPLFALSGIAYCGLCETRVARRIGPPIKNGSGDGRYMYLGCWSKGCVNHSRRQEVVEDAALVALTAFVGDVEAARSTIRAAVEIVKRDGTLKARRLRKQDQEVEGACRRLEDRMETMLSEGSAVFASTLADLRQRLANGRRELAQAEAAMSLSLSPDDEADFLGWCSDMVARWKNFEPWERLVALRMGFARATFGDGGSVSLQPRLPPVKRDRQIKQPPPRIELE